VEWPADTDKTGKAWLTPISPDVRARFLKMLREQLGIGSAPMFPRPAVVIKVLRIPPDLPEDEQDAWIAAHPEAISKVVEMDSRGMIRGITRYDH
jgi:hypothetical protein